MAVGSVVLPGEKPVPSPLEANLDLWPRCFILWRESGNRLELCTASPTLHHHILLIAFDIQSRESVFIYISAVKRQTPLSFRPCARWTCHWGVCGNLPIRQAGSALLLKRKWWTTVGQRKGWFNTLTTAFPLFFNRSSLNSLWRFDAAAPQTRHVKIQ